MKAAMYDLKCNEEIKMKNDCLTMFCAEFMSVCFMGMLFVDLHVDE